MADHEMPVVGMEHLQPYPTPHIEISPLEQQSTESVEQEHLETVNPPTDAGGLEEHTQPEKHSSTEQIQLSPEDAVIGAVSIRSGIVPVADLDHLEDDLDTTTSKPVQVKPKMASLRLQTRGGRMRADQDRIKSLIKEAIINMCNTGLYYQTEMRIEGLLGVTLDRREVILVNVHDIIRTSESDDEYTNKIPFTPTVHKRKMSRPWRVTGRNYIKRAPRRAAPTAHRDDVPILKKRRKLTENLEEDDENMELFTNTSFSQSENDQSVQENDSLSSSNIPSSDPLGQAVSWYASVEEQARMGDTPLMNDHGLPLPDPLTSPEKADMICMINEQVARGFVKKQEKKKRRGEYNNYTAEMRAKIGQYAVEQGIGKAMKHFKSLFGRPISESTVRCMRKAYLDAKLETQADEVVVLPKKDRGRPLMLKEYDTDVMEYIENLRRNGAQINVQIVMDAARGVLLHKDKTRLKEFGGTIEITKAWAQSFMARKGLHGLGRRRRKSEGQKSPKKKKDAKVEEGTQDPPGSQQQQQQQHQPQHQPTMQHHQIPQQHHPGPPHQQQQLAQQQQQQHHNQQQQQQSLSQHPTPVHTPHPQEHETHLHNLDVCTPPPAHESRNNTMVFPERQMHTGDPTATMHDPHRNAMVFERQHHPHPAEHGAPPPMHDHTGRMIFPDRHTMAGPGTPSMQDPHHMFFPERLNLNPVPPAHCSLWPSQNIHHKNN